MEPAPHGPKPPLAATPKPRYRGKRSHCGHPRRLCASTDTVAPKYFAGHPDQPASAKSALSELAERTLQSVDLVLESVGRRIQPELSGGDPSELADHEHYIFLKEKMAGLPQIDALGIIDVQGNRLNLSRDWPSPKADLSQREYFKELSANPK